MRATPCFLSARSPDRGSLASGSGDAQRPGLMRSRSLPSRAEAPARSGAAVDASPPHTDPTYRRQSRQETNLDEATLPAPPPGDLSTAATTSAEPSATQDGGGHEAPTSPPTVTRPTSTQRPAGIGRIVHVFHPDGWRGGRPAIVVGIDPEQGISANVFVDGQRDTDALRLVRASPYGNTFPGLSLYEPLSHEERQLLVGSGPWAEWPLLEAGLI